ncbi:MAG: hypothetical protein U0354_19625 [Candidatus Sericytochromatia bacterium]
MFQLDEFRLDERGLIYPYDKVIKTNLLTVFNKFVNDFDLSSSRKEIFRYYLKYIQDFSKDVTSNWTQWLGGSYFTNKLNPKDIDLVNFIKNEYVINTSPQVLRKYMKLSNTALEIMKFEKELDSLDLYKIDGSIIPILDLSKPEYQEGGEKFEYRKTIESKFEHYTALFSNDLRDGISKRRGILSVKIDFNNEEFKNDFYSLKESLK